MNQVYYWPVPFWSRPFLLRSLAGSKSVVAGYFAEVACVVEGEDADIVAAADLETVYAAVGRDQPGCLFGIAIDRTQQVQSEITDGTCV